MMNDDDDYDDDDDDVYNEEDHDSYDDDDDGLFGRQASAVSSCVPRRHDVEWIDLLCQGIHDTPHTHLL